MPPELCTLAVLASGGGSTFQAIAEACSRGDIPARVGVLFSNNPKAGVLDRARAAGIPSFAVSHKDCATPEELDKAILEGLAPHHPDWICLAGYLRLLTPGFVRAYSGRILNIHPALLPAFGGKGLYGLRVHRAVLEAGVKITGVTVHLADEQFDHGPILVQEAVPVREDDTPETLARRVLEVEHRAYPAALKLCAEGRVRFEGGKARIL